MDMSFVYFAQESQGKKYGIGGSMAQSFGKKTNGKTEMLHMDLDRRMLEVVFLM